MGNLYVKSESGGGVDCDNASASTTDILSGKTAGLAGSDELATGTMNNNGTWSRYVGMNDSVSIPKGSHSGSGVVTGPSVTQRGAWSATAPMNSSVSVPQGYHNGSGYVAGPSIPYQSPEVDGDRAYATAISCSPGQINLGIRNGHYLNGVNWIKGSFPTLVPANIKKGVNIGGVVGTWEGYVTNPLIFLTKDGYTSYCPNGIVNNTSYNSVIYQDNYTDRGRIDLIFSPSLFNGNWTGGVFRDQFVVTAYNYVSMTCYVTANISQTIAFGVGTSSNIDALKGSAYVTKDSMATIKDPVTLTVNISNLSGRMYVIISGKSHSSGRAGRITVNKIWFHN